MSLNMGSFSIDMIVKMIEELAEVRALQFEAQHVGNGEASYNFEAFDSEERTV